MKRLKIICHFSVNSNYEVLRITPANEEEGYIFHAIGASSPIITGIQTGITECLVKTLNSPTATNTFDLE